MAKSPKAEKDSLSWLSQKLLAFENSNNINRVVYALGGLCAVLFVADFLYKKKSYFEFEGILGFYALFGLGAVIVLILLGKALRFLLARDENYYAPFSTDDEKYSDLKLEQEVQND